MAFPIKAAAVEEQRGYIRLGVLAPQAAFGLDYHSKKSDGTVKLKFQDETDMRSESAAPWISFGVRVYDRIWLGGDYMAVSGEGEGKVGKKVHLGPFSFFVNVPTSDTYHFDIGRVWAGYRVLESENGSLMIMGGATAVQARAKAEIPGLARESASGILPMPMLGGVLKYSGPWLTEWTLAADYSRININDVDGRVTSISLSVERPVVENLQIGLGYKCHDLSIKADRSNYDARLDQRLSAPYLYLNYVF